MMIFVLKSYLKGIREILIAKVRSLNFPHKISLNVKKNPKKIPKNFQKRFHYKKK